MHTCLLVVVCCWWLCAVHCVLMHAIARCVVVFCGVLRFVVVSRSMLCVGECGVSLCCTWGVLCAVYCVCGC